MQIVHNQLRGPERVFFASAQALACGLSLYLAYAAASVLAVEAATPGDLHGRGPNLAFWLLLAVCLATAAVTAFLAWTFARGAKIGVTRREAAMIRVGVGIAILASAGAWLYSFLR